MAKANPESDDDLQSDKSAKEKVVPADQPAAPEDDVSTKPPKRVHLFTEKPRPDDSTKSRGNKLQYSLYRTNGLIGSPGQISQPAISAAVRPPIIAFKEELIHLRERIEQGKKALYEVALKAEDLEAMMQGLRQTRDRIGEKRLRPTQP